MKKVFLLSFLLLGVLTASAQNYTRRDSLQGGLRPERTCFDVQRYDLNITLNPERKYISGYNNITFKFMKNTGRNQLDLYENMTIDSIVFNGTKMKYKRDEDAVFINFTDKLKKGSEQKLPFYYS